MHTLIKSVKAATTSSKGTLIKNSITTQLSNSVKEIQLYTMDENMSHDSLQMNEAENALCSVIEAMLLHGLKDSLVHRARRAIADVDEKPEPSFWAPLLVISHRQIIDQITNLSQITTEIGQCRAWVRLALNDSLLSSYLSTMREDSSVLKPFYNTHAYVRDSELLDVAQRLIEGVETFTEFSFPCNSSLLNTWQLQSLILAGIWSPTLRSCPVAAGVDVAQSLQPMSAMNSETGSLSSAISLNSHSSGLGPMLAMNEDEALKIILAKHSSEQQQQQTMTTPNLQPLLEDRKVNTSDLSDIETTSIESEANIHPEPNLGNSLNRRSGWSFSETQEKNDRSDRESSSPNAVSSSGDPDGSKSMETSYNALIESYNMLGGAYIKTPDLREVWQHLERKSNEEIEQTLKVQTPEELINPELNQSESLPLAVHIGKIARERGLDYQNYECANCKEPLGLMPKPKICSFTADYVCDNCISTEFIQLPARVIHNWDFKTYQVSQKALNYITEVKDHPTIDLKILNPYIYTVSEEMSKLQALRIQLNFLRDYLYTCREPIIEQLQKQICGREYMYEHVHQYSISDLSQIRSGALVQHLQKVVAFAIEHVQNCWLCSQKGFICEICNKSKVLYPFDIENVYRCSVCNAVYHNGCLNSTRPCPKCERKKKREDLPLLGATME
ncbi:hypothetical protein ILUMI_20485 [Ignelater luminosus]|uniref:RUN domain-containing protein n=1 Tax=Ignelater luminosus TaxID=2038154 RepID=A0A8K0CKM0_IGNLU|nr:hypothetical protein ILUMI_20485 [Ignelater luminosus]